jgi:hypothetical protein
MCRASIAPPLQSLDVGPGRLVCFKPNHPLESFIEKLVVLRPVDRRSHPKVPVRLEEPAALTAFFQTRHCNRKSHLPRAKKATRPEIGDVWKFCPRNKRNNLPVSKLLLDLMLINPAIGREDSCVCHLPTLFRRALLERRLKSSYPEKKASNRGLNLIYSVTGMVRTKWEGALLRETRQ